MNYVQIAKFYLKFKKVGVLPIYGMWGLTCRAKVFRQARRPFGQARRGPYVRPEGALTSGPKAITFLFDEQPLLETLEFVFRVSTANQPFYITQLLLKFYVGCGIRKLVGHELGKGKKGRIGGRGRNLYFLKFSF